MNPNNKNKNKNNKNNNTLTCIFIRTSTTLPRPLYFVTIPEESEAAEAITQGSSHGRYWGLAQQWLVDEERGEAVGRASMRRGSEGTLVATGGASPAKGKRGGKAPELGPEVGSRDCPPPPFAPSYFDLIP